MNPEPIAERKKRFEVAENILLFFPEALIGAFLVLVAPLLAIKLPVNGHFFAAFAIVCATLGCGYGIVWALRNKQKFVAYAILLFFIGFTITLSSELP